jgi:hypothetical protein
MPATLSGPYLITTYPSLTKCAKCRRMVLAVTVNGLDRHIDPTALNEVGELAALIEGRKSYELHSSTMVSRGKCQLGRPRREGLLVMADHNCRTPPQAHCDQQYMDRALALVRRLLGAEEVTPMEPPF